MVTKCECLECLKADSYERQIMKRNLALVADHLEDDHAEAGTADKYLGGKLVALKTVNVYSRPGGSLIKTIKPGETVGVIASFINTSNGVWWNVTGKNYTGFVLHGDGTSFSADALKQSLIENQRAKDAALNEAVEARKEANESLLYNVGASLLDFDFLKQVIIGVVVVIVGAVLYRMFKN